MQFHSKDERIQLEYEVSGKGNKEAILFIPGLGADVRQFEKQHRDFASDFCVVSVSLPGHGESRIEMPARVHDYDLLNTARLLIDLMDMLGYVRFHVVGNSTGGLVGYELLAHYAERLCSLTTFGTTAELHSGFLGSVVILMDQLLGPKVSGWLAERTVSKKAETAQLVGAMIRETPTGTVVAYRKQIRDYNYLPVLRDHEEVPVLLLRGEQDTEINTMLGSTLQALERHGKAVVRKVADAGHFLNLDQPEVFRRELTVFLEGHGCLVPDV